MRSSGGRWRGTRQGRLWRGVARMPGASRGGGKGDAWGSASNRQAGDIAAAAKTTARGGVPLFQQRGRKKKGSKDGFEIFQKPRGLTIK